MSIEAQLLSRGISESLHAQSGNDGKECVLTIARILATPFLPIGDETKMSSKLSVPGFSIG